MVTSDLNNFGMDRARKLEFLLEVVLWDCFLHIKSQALGGGKTKENIKGTIFENDKFDLAH